MNWYRVGKQSLRKGLTKTQFYKLYSEKAGLKKPDEAYSEYEKAFKKVKK